MYILERVGVYGQGVFWVGESLEDGIKEADKAAEMDVDDHHEWQVKEIVINDENYRKGRPSNVIEYSVRKGS